MADEPKGRQIQIDETAGSADSSLPAFIARPEGAPVYHGFPVLEDVEIDGFRLGMISGFGGEWSIDDGMDGDAFVVAPDDSRCGLVWDVGGSPPFEEVCAPDASRWGVWGVSFDWPMTSRENARKNLETILPQLKDKWKAWRSQPRP
ncbi:MAG: hypothetical protein ABSG84_16900 [Acidobacteriaceae bacterium]